MLGVSDCSTYPALPLFSLPVLRPPYLLRHTIEIRPVSDPVVASKHSSERKSHTSLTLNHKLEMIQLSEEKAKIGPKPAPPHPATNQLAKCVNAKEKFLKEMKGATH